MGRRGPARTPTVALLKRGSALAPGRVRAERAAAADGCPICGEAHGFRGLDPEEPLPLAELLPMCPYPQSQAELGRWCRRGLLGVKLQCVRRDGRWHASLTDVGQFLGRVVGIENDRGACSLPAMPN